MAPRSEFPAAEIKPEGGLQFFLEQVRLKLQQIFTSTISIAGPFTSTGAISSSGAITGAYFSDLVSSPAQIVANTDNLAIGSFGWLRLNTDASRNITGFAGGVSGRELLITNVGAQNIVLVEQATSTAANQIITGTGSNVTIATLKSVRLKYDGTSSRWRIVSTY